jgi:hypothetical protein
MRRWLLSTQRCGQAFSWSLSLSAFIVVVRGC